MELELPFPPSANTYYRRVGNRTLISRSGRAYRTAVCALAGGSGRPPIDGRVALAMDAFPPDRRRRDLDNLLKALCDALAHAGVYRDDSQIDLLIVRRRDPVKGGRLTVSAQPLDGLSDCPLCGRPIGPGEPWPS
jgi:crossover junction endodeoxyribonuclease RusA